MSIEGYIPVPEANRSVASARDKNGIICRRVVKTVDCIEICIFLIQIVNMCTNISNFEGLTSDFENSTRDPRSIN